MGDDERKKSDASKVSTTRSKTGSAVLLPSLATDTLFAGASEILIQHEEDIYRLRITRNRKLILTK